MWYKFCFEMVNVSAIRRYMISVMRRCGDRKCANLVEVVSQRVVLCMPLSLLVLLLPPLLLLPLLPPPLELPM